MWYKVICLVILSFLYFSCGGNCHYRDIAISASIKDTSVKTGDSLSLQFNLACKKKGQIATGKEPFVNLYFVTDSGAKLERKHNDGNGSGYILRQSPVTLVLKVIIQKDEKGPFLSFIDTGNRIRLNHGKTRLSVYYQPPKGSIGWSDSDEGHPSTDFNLTIVE